MGSRFLARLACHAAVVALSLVPSLSRGQESLPIPIGLEAYRAWESWPLQRTGLRAYMRSTYDRRGGNEGADASHFLYQLADDRNVTLDLAGAGLLCFARYNHWHGSPWVYEVDGKPFVVSESSTPDPNHPRADSRFLPEALFPRPLAWTWSDTKGADLSWVPIGFEQSFRMAYSRTHYGTGYYIVQKWVPGTALRGSVAAWDGQTPPQSDVLRLIDRAGDDIAPQGGVDGTVELGGTVALLRPEQAVEIANIRSEQPAQLRLLHFSIPRRSAVNFGHCRLRVTWDGAEQPSIDAPIALFHGAGRLYNRDDRPYLVKSFPMNIRFDAERVELSCYFPMPFSGSARIELVGNGAEAVEDVRWRVRHQPLRVPFEQVGLFHATYRDHPHPVRGQDLVLLDTRAEEGGGDWSGQLVGMSWIFSHAANLTTLEGDPRFFFDDSLTPQAQGTGTEEWGGGGDYWGGINMTLPFAGHPTGAKSLAESKGPDDQVESAYRFLLGDLMPFGRAAQIRLEHGGMNESNEHYETVTYWYARRGASLVRTDRLEIGDRESERVHEYVSPEASEPVTIESRYEWGPDSDRGDLYYPAESARGRTTTGTSEFTLAVDPRNVGVMLRRKLDYQYPNQRADVFIWGAAENGPPDWQPAGTWYLAGSNTCVYSNPKEELGATQHIVQTSNRRLRDDEFLLPRRLTEGRDRIRVRVRFRPVGRPLFPADRVPVEAWSEMRYDAECFLPPAAG